MTRLLIMGTLMLVAADLSADSGALVKIDTLDGRTSSGVLAGLSANQIVVQSPAGKETFPLTNVLTVRPYDQESSSAKLPTVWLELTDGSRLPALRYLVTGGKAAVIAIDDSEFDIPTRSIAAVRFKQQDNQIAKQWDHVLHVGAAGDLIVVRKEKAIDYLEGVLGDVSESIVDFKVDGEVIAVPRTRVEGLVYYHGQPADLPESTCIVTSVDGIRFEAREAAIAGDRLQLVGLGGLKWTPRIDSIRQIDFSAGKVQYLSDLEPESVLWNPYFAVPGAAKAIARFGQPRRDAAREGGPLQLAGKQYGKGLALLSRTEIVYRLPDRFRWFLSTAGIDDRVGQRGHVRLIIHGDDRRLFDDVLRGGDDPLPLKLDVEGVKRLKIVVDYGDDMDVADHLDLADARVSK